MHTFAATREDARAPPIYGFQISISAPIGTAMGGALAASSEKLFKRRLSQHQNGSCAERFLEQRGAGTK